MPVYLFPDTNVFIQCLPLDQLDWSAWREAEEVHLIVSRPVQTEIDAHKNKGGDRLAKRSRAASSLLRELILSELDSSIIRPADPVVRLFIRSTVKPSPNHADVLDYTRFDDQLVGIAQAFKLQNPGADVRVLTDDTGPMASARMIALAVSPVPDNWRLPREASETDRKIKTLEAEVAKLKETEPRFSINCTYGDIDDAQRLDIEVIIYEKLPASELEAMLEKLDAKFPLATDFGPSEPKERAAPRSFDIFRIGATERFTPASAAEIDSYREDRQRWIKECRSFLSNLHVTLQRRDGHPRFLFNAVNTGTRPALDALVTISSKGPMRIMTPPDEPEGGEKLKISQLPTPPRVPRGNWQTIDHLRPILGRGFTQFSDPSAMGIGHHVVNTSSLLTRIPLVKKRDANKFYYKHNDTGVPVDSFSRECQQWRHGIEPEPFAGVIVIDNGSRDIEGALECRIEASNLSQHVTKTVPIRLRMRPTLISIIVSDMIDRLA